jgi:hypothetical protein
VYIAIFTLLSIVCLVEVITTFGVLPFEYVITERLVIVIEVALQIITMFGYYNIAQMEFESVS